MKMFKRATKILARLVLAMIGLAILLVLFLVIAFLWQDQTNGKLETSGQERRYLLYVPESYDPSTPVPLVISIHGFAEWPAHEMELSHWNSLAEKYGFIVVYPSGSSFPKHWRTRGEAGTPNDPAIDIRFISDLIDQLEGEYNIDQARIYINGLSNGGGMSVLLGCKLSKRIAALGSVAGAYTFTPDECNPSRPVPLIVFHGDSDPIVPYQGGRSSSFDFPAVPDFIKGWAQLNGCELTPVELPAVGEVSSIRYTRCKEEAEVVFYTIHGGGHSWPGGKPLPEWLTGHTTQDIDATQLMWEFFSQASSEK